MKQIKPIDQITNVQLAIQQYQMFMPEIHALKQFIYTFRNWLENLYFVKTDIHLLLLPTTLYKKTSRPRFISHRCEKLIRYFYFLKNRISKRWASKPHLILK